VWKLGLGASVETGLGCWLSRSLSWPCSCLFMKLMYSMHIWMMAWYDAWNALCMNFPFVYFRKQIRIDPHFIVISNSWNHSTLNFFTFSNHFFGLISLLTNTFLIIFLKHYLNDMHEIAKGLLTRELPQFELVSGHKMCLGFPSWGGGKMIRSSQVAPNVINIFNISKCPNSKWMMRIYESQTKWLPQFGFEIDKDGLC